MSGPIVRTGTNPAYWANWDSVFGAGKSKSAGTKKAAKKAVKKVATKTAKKVAKKVAKKTAKKKA